MKRPWTRRELAHLTLSAAAGVPLPDLARHYGRSLGSVRLKAYTLALDVPPARRAEEVRRRKERSLLRCQLVRARKGE